MSIILISDLNPSFLKTLANKSYIIYKECGIGMHGDENEVKFKERIKLMKAARINGPKQFEILEALLYDVRLTHPQWVASYWARNHRLFV